MITRREIAKLPGAATVTGAFRAAADEICFLTATERAKKIRRKEISARDVMAAHLRQIERVNPKVNAIVTLVTDQAIERFEQATGAGKRRPSVAG